jgi:hypothetical protein
MHFHQQCTRVPFFSASLLAFVVVCLLFYSNGVLNLGTCACYHLSNTPNFSYFSQRVSHFLSRMALDYDPSTYASHVAGITGMGRHSWPLFVFLIIGILNGRRWNLSTVLICIAFWARYVEHLLMC